MVRVNASRSAARMLTSRWGSLDIAWRSRRSPPSSASSVSRALAIPSPAGTEAELDDVTGLLAAERPAAAAQLVENVAVADRGARHLHAHRRHRGMEAEVGHHGDCHATADQAV